MGKYIEELIKEIQEDYGITETKKDHNNIPKKRRINKQANVPVVQKSTLYFNSILVSTTTLLIFVFTLVILVLIGFFSIVSHPENPVFGYRIIQAEQNNMAPTSGIKSDSFREGDLILIQDLTPATKIVKQDIVAYRLVNTTQNYTIQRVKETLSELNGKVGEYLLTAAESDENIKIYLSKSSIIGKKVGKFSFLGTVYDINRNYAFLTRLMICLIYFCLFLIRYLAKKERDEVLIFQ